MSGARLASAWADTESRVPSVATYGVVWAGLTAGKAPKARAAASTSGRRARREDDCGMNNSLMVGLGLGRSGERFVSPVGVADDARTATQSARVMLSPMLYLASKSPRRHELLGRLVEPAGLEFGVLDLDIPEHRAARRTRGGLRAPCRPREGRCRPAQGGRQPVRGGAGRRHRSGARRRGLRQAGRRRRRRGDAAQAVRAHPPGDLGGLAGVAVARGAGGVGLGSDLRRTQPRRRSMPTSPAASRTAAPARTPSRAWPKPSSPVCPAATPA